MVKSNTESEIGGGKPGNRVVAPLVAKGDWVSVSVAARRLSKSERQVWRMVDSGVLDSALVDGRRLVAAESVEKAKKPLTRQWQCQSESPYTSIVEAILTKLKPAVEQAVREHLEPK